MAPHGSVDIDNLTPGSHVCCIHSTEQEHRELVVRFVAAGLSQNQKVIYILDEHPRQEICDHLAAAGIDVEASIAGGQLALLSSAETYLRSGAFVPDEMIALLDEETRLARSQGYAALRVTGEMTWATAGAEGCERLVEYEAKLNRFFPGQECLAMCQYHRSRFAAQTLLDVLSTHPVAFIGLEAFENQLYVDPDAFLAVDSATARFDNALQGLAHRKRAARLLAEQHENLRGLLNNNADGVLVVDRAGVIRFSNQTAERLFGRSGAELVGQVFGHLLDSDAPAEIELLPPGGEPLIADMRVVATHWEGEPAYLATLRDITEKLKIARQIRDSEARLRAVTRSATDAIITMDSRGLISELNPAAERMFGYTAAELVGKPMTALMPESFRQLHEQGIDRLRAGGAARHLGSTVELTGLHRDGSEVPLELSLSHWEANEGHFYTGIIRDVTDRNRLRAQIAQADRLSSMGMLAAGVAHEINNPLSYVLYNLESLSGDLQELLAAMREAIARLQDHMGAEALDDILGDAGRLMNPAMLNDVRERFEDALGGTQRIRDISRGLSTFSRVERDQLVAVNVMHVLEVAINMAFNEIKYRARLVKDYGKVPAVMASEGRLAQVFLNLIINATHAIEEGDVDGNEIRIRTWAEGDEVLAEVRDTGEGIPPENLPRLFDSFFTTKKIGVGSGLGLAISKNIIEGYGGSISVSSEPGEGTSFTIRLPTQSAAVKEPTAPPAEAAAAQARGRILIVDDEDGIRAAMVRMLRAHDTAQAASGTAARQILEEDQAFDLILCDMMMPDVSGMDLHEWLAAQHPRLARQFIFVTGGAFTPRARAYLKKVDNLRLEKPFDAANFKKIIDDIIWRVHNEEER